MQEGPYSLEELKQKLLQGECSLAHYVVDEETDARVPLGSLPGMPVPEKPQTPAINYLRDALDYYHGLNGKPKDYALCAEYARLGHEQGDLNCTAELCSLYMDGAGVARDYSVAFELAMYMERHRYAPAFRFLAEAYANGYGTKMDMARAKACAERLESELASPVEGVDEDIRYASLFEVAVLFEKRDARRSEELAREALRASSLPYYHGWLALELLEQLETSPSVADELRSELEKGCSMGDELSLFLKAILLQIDEGSVYRQDVSEAGRLMAQLTDSDVSAPALWQLVTAAETAEQAEHSLARFWDVCQHGISRLRRDDALPCDITLQRNDFVCGWKVCEHSVVTSLYNAKRIEELVILFRPSIVLTNHSNNTMSGISMRLCAMDKELDRTIELDESIPPGQCLEVNPADFGIELAKELYVEVHCGGRYAGMKLESPRGYQDFCCSMDDAPPLIFWWEKGFWGGYVLKAACFQGRVDNVVVRKKGGETKPVSLTEDSAAASFGWCEFSDSNGLTENEIFIVTCDNCPPIVGRIQTTPDDQGRAGWLKVAGGAAALVGGVVLGS